MRLSDKSVVVNCNERESGAEAATRAVQNQNRDECRAEPNAEHKAERESEKNRQSLVRWERKKSEKELADS